MDRPDGPILNRPEHGYVIAEAAQGQVFTDGLETLEVTEDLPIVIDKITIDGATGSLELVGAWLAGPNRLTGIIQRVEGFPPDDRHFGNVIPAVGATLQPASELAGTRDYELLLGLRILSNESDLRRGVWVEYHTSEDEYVDYLEAKAVLCPTGRTDRACAADFRIEL